MTEHERAEETGPSADDIRDIRDDASAVLASLLEAGPEAVDHLLKAAQELLLAAKAVVDAGERAVESHRKATDAAARAGDAPDRDRRVRRIDLA